MDGEHNCHSWSLFSFPCLIMGSARSSLLAFLLLSLLCCTFMAEASPTSMSVTVAREAAQESLVTLEQSKSRIYLCSGNRN